MSPYRAAPAGPVWWRRWLAAFLIRWDDPLGRKEAQRRREALAAVERSKRAAAISEAMALLAQIPNHYERERRTIEFEMLSGVRLPRPWAEK